MGSATQMTPMSQTYGWSSDRWQNLPLVHMWILIVCVENIHPSFHPPVFTAKRLIPYRRCSYQEYLSLPSCSAWCSTSASLVTAHSKHTEFLGCCISPAESQDHHKLSDFLSMYMCLTIFHFLSALLSSIPWAIEDALQGHKLSLEESYIYRVVSGKENDHPFQRGAAVGHSKPLGAQMISSQAILTDLSHRISLLPCCSYADLFFFSIALLFSLQWK